jgi:signal transduction histidine kinase/CheY-like chemotaxis protein
LDFIHQALADCPAATWQPQLWLAGLAQAFQTKGAGFAILCGRTPAVKQWIGSDGRPITVSQWPWDEWPGLISEVGAAPLALARQSSTGTTLLFTVHLDQEEVRWLLWLEDGPNRAWTAPEQAALTLAVLALKRQASQGTSNARWELWAEYQRRQQRLEDATLIIGRLVHDFNNLLTGVLGFTELSLAQVPANSAPHKFMTGALQAAQQGCQLIWQLSRFSKRSKTTAHTTLPEPVLAAEESRVRSQWGSRASIQFHAVGALPAVPLDSDSLAVLVGRLLDNACEAIVGGGSVTVSARLAHLQPGECLELLGDPAPGPCLHITVQDTGAGFSPEAQQRVFVEPFYSSKSRHRGLGLVTVYSALHGARGGIRLEHGLSSGTTVHVYIPAVSVPATLPAVGRSQSGRCRGERLLVVDDDPLTLQLMCTTLERAGYQVDSAANGPAALENFSKAAEPYRLLLSDVVMPRMNGFDLAQRLLEQDPGLQVLFTSGHIPPGFVPERFTHRQFDLLPKPFRPECLLRAVRSALEPSKAGTG